jgi:hypothetical protein
VCGERTSSLWTDHTLTSTSLLGPVTRYQSSTKAPPDTAYDMCQLPGFTAYCNRLYRIHSQPPAPHIPLPLHSREPRLLHRRDPAVIENYAVSCMAVWFAFSQRHAPKPARKAVLLLHIDMLAARSSSGERIPSTSVSLSSFRVPSCAVFYSFDTGATAAMPSAYIASRFAL